MYSWPLFSPHVNMLQKNILVAAQYFPSHITITNVMSIQCKTGDLKFLSPRNLWLKDNADYSLPLNHSILRMYRWKMQLFTLSSTCYPLIFNSCLFFPPPLNMELSTLSNTISHWLHLKNLWVSSCRTHLLFPILVNV